MTTFNLTDQTNLFKINYYKKSENMYNSYNILHGRIKKRYDFVGKQRFVSTPMSFSGGVGSGTLPGSNAANYEGAIITAKKVYATCGIDRESIKASQGKEGAFVEATRETVQKTVESYMRNCSRILFGDGTGELGRGYATGANVTGNGSYVTPWVVEIDNDLFNEAHFEEKDFVNIVVAGTPETTVVEIVEVDPENFKISLAIPTNPGYGLVGGSARLTALAGGPGPMLSTDLMVMQGSYNNDPQGLKGIADAVVGVTSLYGITAQRRWSMKVTDALGAGINPDAMNGIMLEVERKAGKTPNMIMTSYAQLQKILDFLEDQKVYNLPAKNVKGNISYSGVEFMSTRGAIGIFTDRFCDNDRMYFLNDNRIEVHHRPGFGWFDDDGTVFLRSSNEDEYGARYGGYYENYITPTGHGCLKGLAV